MPLASKSILINDAVAHRGQKPFGRFEMPLDSAGYPVDLIELDRDLTRRRNRTLADTLQSLNLRPIDPQVLEDHKKMMMERYPASWLWDHTWIVQIAANGLASWALVLTFFALFTGSATVTSMGIAFALLTMLAFGMARRIHGPAEWSERRYCTFEAVARRALSTNESLPGQVYALATMLGGVHPRDLVWTYGELTRASRVIDPYLIVQDDFDGERYILGIWEDGKVLHIAQPIV